MKIQPRFVKDKNQNMTIRTLLIAACIGAVIMLGYNYYDLKQTNEQLLKSNGELSNKLSDITAINNEQSTTIHKLTELRKDDDKTLTTYINTNNSLLTEIDSVNKVRKLKEKEVQELKRKFIQDHPDLKDDPDIELKFFTLSSDIRIDSVHTTYCSLFKCENSP